MDWKKEAIEKLKDLEARKAALRNIPLERQRLRSVLEGIRSAGVDGDPVSGSTNRREDRLLGCIVALQELDRAEVQAKAWVDMVAGAMQVLPEDDRLVLDRLFVCPLRGSFDRVCQELALEKTAVYYRRDRALRRFTLALYGAMEC